MKSAKFIYEGSPRDKRVERVYGKVTLKDDGKLSISFPGIKDSWVSYAAKYAAKLLAQEIVKADFKHPAVYDFQSTESSHGLMKQLIDMTVDFKADYIVRVKEAAARMFAHHEKRNAWSYEKWMDEFHVPYEMKTQFGKSWASPIEMNKKYYSMRNQMIFSRGLVSGGFKKFEEQEVKYAEQHFSSAMGKLAYRLNQKGIVDGSDFKIKSARVGVNIEIIIEHSGEITKAWTIVAEGPIQRAHFRYLIK